MSERLQYLVIGNPENRRVTLFQAALKRLGKPAASVLSYRELLQDADGLRRWLRDWQARATSSSRLCIRLDSPGENAQVEQLLIKLGLKMAGERARLRYEHGRIQHVAAWFDGFSDCLSRIAETVAGFDRVRFTSHPHEILLAFNKPACHQHLMAHGISVPEVLTSIASYDDLITRMKTLGWSRVFVKLATGSSASGVVAIHLNSIGVRALTSMEMIGSGQRARFYNNLKLRSYTRERQVATVVNFLCDAGAHVERWLPKAAMGQRNFDLRLLVIAGRPMHCVVRTSRSPITNLHLGNERGDFALLRKRMPTGAWADVLALARQTATAFPRSHMLGLDILLQPGFRLPTVLEVNAFGDLLPGVFYRNCDSYTAQVVALVK